MSIACPACGKLLKQITNTHVKHKHPEFATMIEFRIKFNLNTCWSDDLTTAYISMITGRKRGSYNWTENAIIGWAKAAKSRSGKNHWNYNKEWSNESKNNISNGVKTSNKHLDYVSYQQTDEYKKQRLTTAEKSIAKQFETKIGKGLILPSEYKIEFILYNKLVKSITLSHFRHWKLLIDPNNFREQGYEIDHMFSRFHGFIHGINPIIIGSAANLMMLPATINRDKWHRSSITQTELINRYSIFNTFNSKQAVKIQEHWEFLSIDITKIRTITDNAFELYHLPNDVKDLIPKFSDQAQNL
jgi:phage FluMu protein Com